MVLCTQGKGWYGVWGNLEEASQVGGRTYAKSLKEGSLRLFREEQVVTGDEIWMYKGTP